MTASARHPAAQPRPGRRRRWGEIMASARHSAVRLSVVKAVRSESGDVFESRTVVKLLATARGMRFGIPSPPEPIF